jgi:prophage regulatory protein
MPPNASVAVENPPPPQRLLRVRDVLARLGRSKSSLYRMIQAGEFPAPTEITPNWKAWPEHAVEACIKARTAPPPPLN